MNLSILSLPEIFRYKTCEGETNHGGDEGIGRKAEVIDLTEVRLSE